MDILKLIGRKNELFKNDIANNDHYLNDVIQNHRFLVIGGAGSVGQAVVKEIFSRDPKLLHVVDISENNLVELIRQIRSTEGYKAGEFKTFCLDIGSIEFDHFIHNFGQYDYVFNLAALKHVRSERDPYTLMRMIKVNIINAEKTIEHSINNNSKKYFSVSTDKATNPANMMGATKRVMELLMIKRSLEIPISTARFANVAFSDGSLLFGFDHRMKLFQPLSVPKDVKRYFITAKESGELCLMSGLMGNNREIFFPKLVDNFHLISFKEITIKYVNQMGYDVVVCHTEDEARSKSKEIKKTGKWPCYFFNTDTTGEKRFEEFYTRTEDLDLDIYEDIGIIKLDYEYDENSLLYFQHEIDTMINNGQWNRKDIINLFCKILPNFDHIEKNKHLDNHL